MFLDQITRADAGTELVAENSLAVQQWEIALAGHDRRGHNAVWASYPLASFPVWLAQHWDEARTSPGRAPAPRLLSQNQTERLWGRVIDESAEGPTLLGPHGMGALARDARRALHDHGVATLAATVSDDSRDAASFSAWNRAFEAHLERNAWIDPDSLLYRFNRLPEPGRADPVIWLDAASPTPERQRLADRWRRRGASVAFVYPDGQQANRKAWLAPDPGAELELVADWAADRLETDPASRLAVVVPDLRGRLDEVETLFGDRLGAARCSVLNQRSIRDIGVCGAAFGALRALGPGSDFAAVSRLLRSPFFSADGQDDMAERASLERWLRADARAGSGFVDAYRRFGLREAFLQRAPSMARRLDLALQQLPRRASPTGWAQALQGSLRTLGWQGFGTALPPAIAASWDSAWSALSELTAIVGSLDLPAALGELERVLARQTLYRPLALSGLHVFGRLGDVGPGYSGAWVTGFSDLNWPEQAARNPLVPWDIRHRHRMPGWSPQHETEIALAELERLSARVPETVFSCPEQVQDQPQLANSHVVGWQRAPVARSGGRSTVTGPRSRPGSRRWQVTRDEAPALVGTTIRGGPRTLDLQAKCPAIAFSTARLRTQALPIPVRGIDARQRGLLLHRVLELIGQGRIDTAVPGLTPDEALRLACDERLPAGDACWQAQVAAERDRLAGLIEALLGLESERAPFALQATELRVDIEIAGHRLRCRIDRVDRLASGEELLIDYKTGKAPTGSWFGERLRDCQLPLYAQHYRGSIAGIAVVSLTDDKVEYRAAGTCVDDLPGRHKRFGHDEWSAQLEHWHDQIAALVVEFAGGDVRISTDLSDRDVQTFAGLTRVREHLG